jgi:mono/diheme cytochrome c family protein
VSILIAGHRMLLIVIVAMGGIVPLVASQGASAANREAIERGRATYEQNSVTCHGNREKGDAPGTAAMKPRPTDLTTLTRQYGAFPAERVEATLKGTDSTQAHTPGMMAWKALFLGDAKGNETTANMRVKDVVAFIASLQPK